jgi:hypothetical protein
MEKPKEPKSSDTCPLPVLSPDPVHGSIFFCFLEVLSKLQKTMKKTKTKITRSSDLCPLPTMSMGLIFFLVISWFWPNCKNHGKTKISKKTKV